MNGLTLHELEQWMKSRIRPGCHSESFTGHSERSEESLVKDPSAYRPQDDKVDILNPQAGDPGEERLSVYAGGYTARIKEGLADVYESVQHVLGDSAFAALAEAYAAAHPSRDYNLSMAGRDLAPFLISYPLTQKLQFLPDLARLEWQVAESFHAFDEPPADLTRIAEMSPERWEELRLVFQPSMGLISSEWPILDIWEARKRPRQEIAIGLINRPQHVLITRRGENVRCELLTPDQRTLLEGLLAGKSLGASCEAIAAGSGGTELPLAAWFAIWAQAGLIVRFDTLKGTGI